LTKIDLCDSHLWDETLTIQRLSSIEQVSSSYTTTNLKFLAKEILRQSKEMDELRNTKQMDGNSFISDREKNEKSK